MKKYIILLLFTVYCTAQTEIDTTLTFKNSWYGRTMFISLTTGTDSNLETLKQRINQNVEIGKSFGVIDIGLSLGNFNNMLNDSNSVKYAEIRINMNACQYGVFSNEITAGVGYMFNSKTPVMLEISSTLFVQIGEKWGLGLVFGNYDFIGDYNNSNKNFFGLYFRYGLVRNEGGLLSSRIRNIQKNKRHNNKRKI